MNSRVRIDKQSLSKWVGVNRRDESSLLLKYLKTNDLSYLLELYRPYMHLVYGLAFKYVKDPKQSQEIVYCIFKKLIKDIKRQEVRVFGNWLYNLSLDFCKQWRDRGRTESDQIVALGGSTQTPVEFYDDKDDDSFEEEISSMEDEVMRIKSQQEKCSQLFFKEQRCFQEIADITGWEVSEIKYHVKNAKRKTNIYQD